MKEPDEAFKDVAKMTGQTYFQPATMRGIPIQLLILGLLFFSGADAMKVLLRTNFGSRSIMMARIIIASLVFLIWSVVCILIIFNTDSQDTIDFFLMNGGEPVLYAASAFYLLLAVSVFILGLKETAKAKNSGKDSFDGGESFIIQYFIGDYINKETVQLSLEPFFIFSFGIALTAINIMLGIPILLCGIALYAYQLFESWSLSSDSVDEKLEEKGLQKEKNYSNVS